MLPYRASSPGRKRLNHVSPLERTLLRDILPPETCLSAFGGWIAVDLDSVNAGFTAYPVYGSLFAGWPACRVALVATPNEFAVVPGPFTKRGVAASLAWYRLRGQKMDEFIRLAKWKAHPADELIAYIGLMQNAEIEA